jgi:hypothetical protein
MELTRDKALQIYKVVKIRDGKYVSGIAGAGAYARFPELEYKIGEVTKAPEGSAGVFCIKNYDCAVANALTDINLRQGLPTAVLEVYPCGERTYCTSLNFPAVYVAKELWRQQPPKPKEQEEPKEVDVTSECKAELWTGSSGWTHIDIKHKGNFIAYLQNSFTLKSCDFRYRIEVDEYHPSRFKVYKKP